MRLYFCFFFTTRIFLASMASKFVQVRARWCSAAIYMHAMVMCMLTTQCSLNDNYWLAMMYDLQKLCMCACASVASVSFVQGFQFTPDICTGF